MDPTPTYFIVGQLYRTSRKVSFSFAERTSADSVNLVKDTIAVCTSTYYDGHKWLCMANLLTTHPTSCEVRVIDDLYESVTWIEINEPTNES